MNTYYDAKTCLVLLKVLILWCLFSEGIWIIWLRDTSLEERPKRITNCLQKPLSSEELQFQLVKQCFMTNNIRDHCKFIFNDSTLMNAWQKADILSLTLFFFCYQKKECLQKQYIYVINLFKLMEVSKISRWISFFQPSSTLMEGLSGSGGQYFFLIPIDVRLWRDDASFYPFRHYLN